MAQGHLHLYEEDPSEGWKPPTDRLPAITGWMFLGILLGMAVFTFGIAALLSIEGTPKRTEALKANKERVLILGASSGIGKELALKYASRGASVCVVARRPDALKDVVAECKGISLSTPSRLASFDGRRKEAFRTEEEVDKLVLGVVGNVSDVDDMVRVREDVERAFGGIDTVLIVAGVSATRPFLSIAGSTMTPLKKEDGPAVINKKSRVRAGATGREGIEKVVDSARKSMETNYLGPVVAYATFLPLLSTTSLSPSILLIASVASLVPAPTRSLYASTKSAALSLHQCVALESDILGLGVRFLAILPGTVRTDLRSKAVDAPVPTSSSCPSSSSSTGLDEKWSKITLEPSYVVDRCVAALDAGGTKNKEIFLPAWPYRVAHLAFYLPGLKGIVESGAREKYRNGM